MALDKQKVQLSIEGGLDTKTDSKNVKGIDFLEVENAVYTKTGALTKRNGYTGYSNSIHPSGSISALSAGTVYQNTEMLAFGGNNAYSYSEAKSAWISKGDVGFASVQTEGLLSGERINTQPMIAFGGGMYAVAAISRIDYVTTLLQIQLKIFDSTTDALLASHTIPDVLNGQMSLEYFSDAFVVLFRDNSSSAVSYRYVQSNALTTLSSLNTIASTFATGLSTVVANSRLYFSYYNGTTIALNYIAALGGAKTSVSLTAAFTPNLTAISASSSSRIRLAWASDSNNLTVTLYNANLSSQIHSPVSFGEPVDGKVSMCINPDNTTEDVVFWSLIGQPYGIKGTRIDAAGALNGLAGMNAAPRYSVFVASQLESRPAVLNGNVYLLVSDRRFTNATTNNVSSYFWVDWKGKVYGRVFADSAASSSFLQTVPTYVSGSKIYSVGTQLSGIMQDLTDSINVPTVVNRLTLDFSASNNYFDVELNKNLHIAGGVLKMYDGDVVVEHGFLQTPNAYAAPSHGTSAGAHLDDNSSYGYAYVYSWTDSKGNLHRSAPHFVTAQTTSTGMPNHTFTHLIDQLNFTAKSNVQIEVYRTEGNGETYYLLTTASTSAILLNDPDGSSGDSYYTFVDDYPDDVLVGNEILYTTGGVLDNFAADSCSHLTTYKSRVILLSSDGSFLQYSKIAESGGPVEFNDALKIELDSVGGRGLAVAPLDDYIIVFKQSGIMITSGEGPNNLGEQDDFRKPQLLTADVGLSDKNSIVSTPFGIMFKSEKGIYVLRRNLQVEYIGDRVEGYNAETITSAALLADTNQVRFTTNGSKALVYDYYQNKWSIFPNVVAVDSIIYKGIYTYVTAAGTVYYEDASSYADPGGTYIPMKLVTAWIQLAGIQGYQRLYKLLALGDYKSAHRLDVSFAYDFDDTYVYTGNRAFNAAGLYQTEFRPTRQKCQAFKVRIVDSETSGDNQGYSLSNFAMEIGTKRGLNKPVTTVSTS